MKEKKVSIIIPVYNGSNYLKQAIDSALNQTYKNIEIIVVNDGSNDNGATEKIAKSYGDKIKYFYKRNGGVSTALNLGIQEATGEYISWLSHDDIYLPEKIAEEINLLNYLKDDKLILFSDYNYIDENNNILETIYVSERTISVDPLLVFYKRLISGISLLIPKQFLIEQGLFNSKHKYVQDYDMWYKLIKNYKWAYLNRVTVSVRIHKNSTSNSAENVINQSEKFWQNLIKKESKETINRVFGSDFNFYIELYNTFKYCNYENLKSVLKEKLITKYFDYLYDEYYVFRKEKTTLENKVNELKKELNAVVTSKSWKITKPLRKLLEVKNKK